MQKMREEWKRQRRDNRRKKRVAAAKERHLSGKNEFGVNDPTPKAAVASIIKEVTEACEAE